MAFFLDRRGIPVIGASDANLGTDDDPHHFTLRTADFENYDPAVAPADTRACRRCGRPAGLHDATCSSCGALLPRAPS